MYSSSLGFSADSDGKVLDLAIVAIVVGFAWLSTRLQAAMDDFLVFSVACVWCAAVMMALMAVFSAFVLILGGSVCF